MNTIKTTLRKELKDKRRGIEPSRREQAESEAFDACLAIQRPYRYVMSYESFGNELSTKELNQSLEKEGKLVLPKIVSGEMKTYHVTDRNDLEASPLGMLEPKTTCEEVDPKEIGLILVPGLGFDAQKTRIGYGKGHYDRFLKNVDEETVTVGLGFREQFYPKDLPKEETDQSLKAVLLF